MSLKKEEGRKALNYLIEERGLSPSVIDDFDFGYCPEGVSHQLRGRIITPIYDSYRNAVALSTRTLDEKKDRRFWHEVFDKGSYLYGLYHAKKYILRYQKVILVEGELDVASLHSHNFKIAVGLLGSAFTLFQASLLTRYCSEVYLLFDGDNAGQKAIERAMVIYKKNNLSSYGIEYIPVKLAGGQDPNDFLRKYDKKDLVEILKEAKEKSNLWT